MAPLVAAALIGGASSLAGSAIEAYSADQDRKAAAKARKEANSQIGGWEQKAEQILRDAERDNISLSSARDLKTYNTLRNNYDPSDYVFTDYEPFDKDAYNVEDYLNPQRDALLKGITQNIQHSAAGSALGHSSGALEAIAQGVLEKDEQLYNDAYNRMTEDRNFDYGAYTDYIAQKQKELDTLQQGRQQQMSMLRGDLTFDQEQRDAMTANRLNLGNTLAQTRASLV